MKHQLLAATLLATLSVPAFAFSTATASLTGLKFELVDLNPKDGVAPSVEFTGFAHVRLQAGSWCGFRGCDEFAPIGTGVLDGSPSWYGAASTSGLHAVSTVNTSGGYYTYNRSIVDLKSRDNIPMFRLSANTGLRITGSYSADGVAWLNPDQGRSSAWATFDAYSGAGRIEGGNQRVSFGVETRNQTPSEFHEQGSFSVLWRNDSNHTAGMWGHFRVTAGAGSVLAVPEPSTYALMAAGLGFVGFVTRKRAKN